MQTKDIEDFLRKEPFQPFFLRLDDGRSMRVTHREAIAFIPGGRSVIIMHPDEFTDRVDVFHIVSIDDRSEAGNGRKGRNGRKKSA